MAVAAAAFGNGAVGAAGVVMKRGLLFSALLLWAAFAQAGEAWDSWWRNADQQGERLMQQGKAAEAAQTYRDPRRKAYAELQAGDFTDAAKHFAPFDDSNGDYNRGNALARAGQLKEAIKAYDAALAHDPNDQDARHNRDLVARALQQQQSRPKSSSPNDSSSKDGKSGDKNQAGQSGQSGDKDSGKQGVNSKNSSGNNASGQSPSGQPQSGNEQQGKAVQGKEDSGKEDSGKSGQAAGQGQQPSGQERQSGLDKQSGASGQANGQPQSGDAEQVQRDAAAALGKSPTGKTGTPSGAPVSEQQLAQEEWLRRIPDDPGGLLRRKFMIEHMIRQQGGQQ